MTAFFYPNSEEAEHARKEEEETEEQDDEEYTGYRSPSHNRKDNCNTERAGLQKFVAVGDQYVLVGNATEEEVNGAGGGLRRKLLLSDSDPFSMFKSHVVVTSPIIASGDAMLGQPSSRLLLEQGNEVLYGRQCLCARTDDVYCPVGASLCRIITPNSRTYQIQCEGETQGMAGRFLLPLVLFLYIVLACLLFASPQGRYTRAYMKKIIFRWSEERYQEELRKEIVFMARRAWEQRQRALAAGRNPNRIHTFSADTIDSLTNPTRYPRNDQSPSSQPAVAVKLKTRLYGQAEQVHECSVCLGELCVGDRVGDVSCGHVFHVEPCLKKWITRNNRCPLCQHSLATPREEESLSTRDTATTEQDRSDPGGSQTNNTEDTVSQN